ncbi:MAG: amidohydrolase family protein, partial [Flavisolibacter sp.]|nr:amidohydrolase family protein [Flavisolibacter sp.]
MLRIAIYIMLLIVFCFYKRPEKADLIVYNAKVYTVDPQFSTAEAFAVKGGKIIALGSSAAITRAYYSDNKINAAGKFVYPGFIDAHAHFYRYGLGLGTADLANTDSWKEILSRLQAFAQTHNEGWLIGRGWDQNDWAVKEFPTKEKLDALFPDQPVLLTRIDG